MRGAALHHNHIIQPEGQQNSFFQPLIYLPLMLSHRLCHTGLAAIQKLKRLANGICNLTLC